MCVGYLALSFDMFNVGDLDVIAQARNHCAELVVGVLDDELTEAVYGRPPVVPITERMMLLRHVRGISDVLVHSGWDRPEVEDWVIFAVSDATPEPPPESILLTPSRGTTSPALREVLQPIPPRAAVA